MEKIKFDHSQKNVFDSLGIGQDRYDEIFEACQSAFLADNNTMSEDIESVVKRLNPTNDAELILIGLQMSRIRELYL